MQIPYKSWTPPLGGGMLLLDKNTPLSEAADNREYHESDRWARRSPHAREPNANRTHSSNTQKTLCGQRGRRASGLLRFVRGFHRVRENGRGITGSFDRVTGADKRRDFGSDGPVISLAGSIYSTCLSTPLGLVRPRKRCIAP